jgi:hypothetical protein
MHRERRMSRGLRSVLAVAAGLSGVMVMVAAPPTDKAPLFHAVGAFCFVLACACLARGRTAQFLGSVVGSAVFITGCWYLASMIEELRTSMGGGRSQPSVRNALLFLVTFGLPGAAYAWHAGFGLRRGSGCGPAGSTDRAP